MYRPTVHKQTWLRTSYIRPRQHPMSHQATQAVSPNVYKHVPRARTCTSSFYHHFSCPGLEAHSATRALPQDVRDNKLKQQPNPGPHGLTKAREDPAGSHNQYCQSKASMHDAHTRQDPQSPNTHSVSLPSHSFTKVRPSRPPTPPRKRGRRSHLTPTPTR